MSKLKMKILPLLGMTLLIGSFLIESPAKGNSQAIKTEQTRLSAIKRDEGSPVTLDAPDNIEFKTEEGYLTASNFSVDNTYHLKLKDKSSNITEYDVNASSVNGYDKPVIDVWNNIDFQNKSLYQICAKGDGTATLDSVYVTLYYMDITNPSNVLTSIKNSFDNDYQNITNGATSTSLILIKTETVSNLESIEIDDTTTMRFVYTTASAYSEKGLFNTQKEICMIDLNDRISKTTDEELIALINTKKNGLLIFEYPKSTRKELLDYYNSSVYSFSLFSLTTDYIADLQKLIAKLTGSHSYSAKSQSKLANLLSQYSVKLRAVKNTDELLSVFDEAQKAINAVSPESLSVGTFGTAYPDGYSYILNGFYGTVSSVDGTEIFNSNSKMTISLVNEEEPESINAALKENKQEATFIRTIKLSVTSLTSEPELLHFQIQLSSTDSDPIGICFPNDLKCQQVFIKQGTISFDCKNNSNIYIVKMNVACFYHYVDIAGLAAYVIYFVAIFFAGHKRTDQFQILGSCAFLAFLLVMTCFMKCTICQILIPISWAVLVGCTLVYSLHGKSKSQVKKEVQEKIQEAENR
ncbi:MAG: hypothetical protein WCS80_05540 [Bacilli bacterium]